jgi:hypothetical protein
VKPKLSFVHVHVLLASRSSANAQAFDHKYRSLSACALIIMISFVVRGALKAMAGI